MSSFHRLPWDGFPAACCSKAGKSRKYKGGWRERRHYTRWRMIYTRAQQGQDGACCCTVMVTPCGLEGCGSQYVEIMFVQGSVELIKILFPSILNLSHCNLADNFSFEKKNQLNSLCCSFHSTIRQSFRPPQAGHISVMSREKLTLLLYYTYL